MKPLAKSLTRLLAIPTVIAVAAALLTGTPSAAAPADDPLSCGDAAVQRALPNGASWRMCARIHPIKGLVLEQIEFKPASGDHEYPGYLPVLDEIYLSQLNVPYDTGHAQFNDITSFGFGDQYLLAQDAKTCTGDTMQIEQAFTHSGRLMQRTIPGICLDEIRTGLATHSEEGKLSEGPRIAAQGAALEVSSLSKIAWYEYQQKIVFDDQGGIDVGLGATGDLAPDDAGGPYFSDDADTGWPLGGAPTSDENHTHGASHWHSAIWRVDPAIGGAGDQFVEQWDYATTDEGTEAPVTRGTGTKKQRAFSAVAGQNHEELSWWRVGNPSSLNPDGHARSYEIVNNNRPNVSIAETEPILTVINDRACAEYASANLHPGCTEDSVLDYVADDDAPLTDPILWVNVGFHHIDRDEDQSPMPMHWQRFQLIPRDFFAQSPSITDARICINGASGDIESTERPCVATNVTRPRITAQSTPIKPGVFLTASNGLWVQNRTTWNYAYMWFRDGEPIMRQDDGAQEPETGTGYLLTEADAGHEITVKVTASQVGYATGVAESRPIAVAGGPEPSPSPSPTVTAPTPPVASNAPAVPQRVKATISAPKSKTVRSKARAKTTVRVEAAGGSATGTVTIKRGNKTVSARLVNGVAKISLPKIKKPGRYRFTIRYAGSSRVLPATAVVTLRVTSR